MSRVFGLLALVSLVLLAIGEPASAQEPCKFVLGFATLRDLIGADKVGRCLEDEHFNLENGNAEQPTSGGLMVWRKIDNFTAFTDGGTSWINGPNGLQSRPNSERFSWEKDPVQPSSPPSAASAPTPNPAVPGGFAQATQQAIQSQATSAARQTQVAAGISSANASATAYTPPPTLTPLPTSASRSSSAGGGDKNCSDFKSQADAQAELRAHPEDRYGLDTDKDGIACESRPAPKDTRKVPR